MGGCICLLDDADGVDLASCQFNKFKDIGTTEDIGDEHRVGVGFGSLGAVAQRAWRLFKVKIDWLGIERGEENGCECTVSQASGGNWIVGEHF